MTRRAVRRPDLAVPWRAGAPRGTGSVPGGQVEPTANDTPDIRSATDRGHRTAPLSQRSRQDSNLRPAD